MTDASKGRGAAGSNPETGAQHLRQATLCLLVRGDPVSAVLLGYKKVGFGAGRVTGFGGKVEAGETLAQAASRELLEETGIVIPAAALVKAAELTFIFPARPAWSQQVHVYLASDWAGQPLESREMRPCWFPVSALPFDEMWRDGAYWLPRILAGERVRARFRFGEDNETVELVEDGELVCGAC